jgi:murein DD-endopeptidase MepM/ murein hydrolase activator NlpD
MWRIYLIGIMYALIVFNVPEIRDQMVQRIQFYTPRVQSTIVGWGDKYTPALRSIIEDLKEAPQTIINGRLIDTVSNTPVDTSDGWELDHKPSITADQFDAILRDYNSPAVGLGTPVTLYAEKKNIDNAYVLYMFIHESTAGNKGVAVHTKSTGNIKCTNGNCYEGFQVYSSWEEGFRKQIDLLADYRDNQGDKTIIEALRRWAPASDNNDQRMDCEQQQKDGQLSYPCGLMINVGKWREANNNVVAITNRIANVTPGKKHNVSKDMHINADFDTVDCAYWGFQDNCQHFGTDIRLFGGEEVYAPFDCTYIMTGHYDEPALRGDYIMCTTNDDYELYSGHLDNAIKLSPGDNIAAGTVIGYGNAKLKHTHMQLRDPSGNLVDFMEYFNKK